MRKSSGIRRQLQWLGVIPALIMLVLRRKPWLFTLCDCSSCCSKRRPTLQVPATQAQLSPRLNAAI